MYRPRGRAEEHGAIVTRTARRKEACERYLAGTHIIGQHGRVRDAGEKIMADARALRCSAVTGHAGAVVQRVRDVQLHVAVSFRVYVGTESRVITCSRRSSTK